MEIKLEGSIDTFALLSGVVTGFVGMCVKGGYRFTTDPLDSLNSLMIQIDKQCVEKETTNED